MERPRSGDQDIIAAGGFARRLIGGRFPVGVLFTGGDAGVMGAFPHRSLGRNELAGGSICGSRQR